MGIKVEGRVFDKTTNNGIEDIKIILIHEGGYFYKTETDKEGIYTFIDVMQIGYFRVIECGSENFDLEDLEVRNFKNSTSKKYYEFEVTQEESMNNESLIGMDFSHDNEKELFNMKNYERVFISPIGDVFFINTFNGEIKFKLNIGIEFSNLSYNQIDKQYYFIKATNGVEIFRVSSENKITNIGKVDELKDLKLEKIISDISIDGILYFMEKESDKIYAVSLNQKRIDFARSCIEFNEFITLETKEEFLALTHNIVDGNIYAIQKRNNLINRIDVFSGEVIELSSNNILKNCEISIMFSDELGYIYTIDDLTGNVYKISLTSNEAKIRLLSEGIRKKQLDILNEKENIVLCNEVNGRNKEKNKKDNFNKLIYNVENGIARGKIYIDNYVKDIKILEDVKSGVFNINKTNGCWTYIPNDEFEGVDKVRIFMIKGNTEYEEIIIEINSKEILSSGIFIEEVSNKENVALDDIIFIADKSFTALDDIINFKISFKNSGNINIQKLILKNLVVKDTIFEKDKIIINNEEFYFDMGTYGIIIDELEAGKTISIEYNLKVININSDTLEFTPLLEYEYFINHKKREEKLLFNTVSIVNIIPKVEIEKYFDVESIIEGDRVKCHIILNNVGNINIKKLVLKEFLDEGIIYNGNLIINGEKSNLSIINGVEFAVITVGQSMHISYESTVKISSLNNLMSFTTDISYNYMVCSKIFEINNQKEIKKIKVLKYDLKIEATFSKKKVSVGEKFELIVNLTNWEKISLDDVRILYPILNQLEILNIHINKDVYEGIIGSNIEVGCIEGKHSKQIIFELRAQQTINFIEDNDIEVIANIKKGSNNISEIREYAKVDKFIEVYNPKLFIKKIVNKEYVTIDEELKMCIVIKNIGDLILENIVLTDLLSSEFEFIEESVIINNKSAVNESIISGINIEKIGINESVEVRCKFKAIKQSDEDPDVRIKAFAVYNYRLDKELFSNTIQSNTCRVNISKIDVEIQKKADKDFVELGEEIKFDIKIINIGTKASLNILFVDELFEGLKLVNRSFSIDGEFINNVDVKKGIMIGDIKVGGIKRISYRVKIFKTNSKLDINTKTYVKYSYILSDGSNGRKMIELNAQDTKKVNIALSNFRQIDKDAYLKIPNEKPDMDEIDGASANIDIFNTHIISTPIVSSIEGQILTGYKLLINGCINETIEYTSKSDSQVIYSTNYKILFSDYIILPVEFNINSRVEVEGKIENIFYKKLNGREFFNNATILLVAKILSA
ncbi:MAG: DUF6923 family protein [Sarcina sp.]